MSVQAMSWALTQQLITEPHARHVLLCLANYADQSGCAAFPSVASLALDTGLAPRTVQYRLRELEARGLIKRGNQAIAAAYISQRDRLPVCYDLDLSRGAQDAPRTVRGAYHNVTGCTPRQNGVQVTTERGAQHAPNPPINHPLTTHNRDAAAAVPSPQKQNRKSAPFDPLTAKPPNVTEQAWADWCQHRKEIHKPLTAKSCEQQAKALAGHSDPDRVLATSISNGWTGIFPEKVLPGAGARPLTLGQPSAVLHVPTHTQDMYPDDRI